MLKEAVHYTNK